MVGRSDSGTRRIAPWRGTASRAGAALIAVGFAVPLCAADAVAPPAIDVRAGPVYTQPILTHSKPVPPVDINSASLEQLKALPGISDAQARRIIAQRPYHSKAQLVSANVMPEGVYISIRHMIIAIQPGPSRPSKHP
jgi:competence protein ComEA